MVLRKLWKKKAKTEKKNARAEELRPGAGPELVNKVKEMSSKGFSEPEIMRTLRNEGYSSLDVDKAIRDSIVGGIGVPNKLEREGPKRPEPKIPAPKDEMPELTEEEMEREGIPVLPEIPGREEVKPPEERVVYETPERPHTKHAPARRPREAGNGENIEELVEVIVAEKWDVFEGRLNDIENRFKDLETKIKEMEDSMSNIKSGKVEGLKDMTNKMETHNQSISEMSQRMESIEIAMKESLVPMMESIRSLSDAVKSLKRK